MGNVRHEFDECPHCPKLVAVRSDGGFYPHKNEEGVQCRPPPPPEVGTVHDLTAGDLRRLIAEVPEDVKVKVVVALGGDTGVIKFEWRDMYGFSADVSIPVDCE